MPSSAPTEHHFKWLAVDATACLQAPAARHQLPQIPASEIFAAMGTKPFATRYKAEKLRQIVEQQVKRLAKRQEDSKLGLEHDGPTLDWLAGIGSDPVFGARPLKRADPAGTENANRCGDPGGQASCRCHHRRGLCARETGPSCSTRSAKPGRRNRGCRPWSVSG